MHPLIATPEMLSTVLPSLAQSERIAIDTEADSLHSYFEKLCLIQISVPGSDMLIDPLAGFSLEPLFETFAGKQLILHGADYDLRLMRRNGYPGPTRIFDTMIAARLTGATEFSLAALILRYFGVQLVKSSQKANWARRPLPEQMIDYAVNDSRYLIQLADIFQAELERLGRVEWFQQSCERAIAASAIIKERDPEQVWRLSGSSELSIRALAVLRSLWHWREQEAQTVNRPTFHILQNELLISCADRFEKGQPVDVVHLRGGRRSRFFEAADAALALPEGEWPKIIKKPRLRPTPEWDERFRAYKQKRDQAAAKHNLDPSLIAPKATLERLAADPAEASARLMPWQREEMGL